MNRLLTVLLALGVSACATNRMQGGDSMVSIAPAMSVESFLQAANSNDYATMANLFGTEDGPVADTGSTFGCAFKKMGSWIGLADSCEKKYVVELRMSAIAHLLKHDTYVLAAENPVPGRQTPTRRVAVNLSQQGRDVNNVPFTVIQAGNGRWLVEAIGLERITESTP